MAVIKKVILWVIAMITRYPGVIAIFGFVSGIASFVLVEREQEKFAQMVSALMLVSWVWLTLENLLKRSVSSWFGVKLPPPLVSFATQLVHQESLFFVIPFFFITTTWNSGQLVFTSLLIIAAFISIIDPIYYRWLAARRWLYFIFHGVTLFAVLLTALPIIFHLPTPKSYLLSLIIALLLSMPGILRAFTFAWWKRILVALVLIVLVWGIGIYIRPWIPPATLRLTEVAVTDQIKQEDRSPENTLSVITEEQLRAGLYAYTAISAPRGLNERIYHVWRLNGMEVDRIALDINGGREAGYRAWTHKLNFPPYPAGRWQIHVITEGKQLIGVLRFQVVKSLESDQSEDANPPAAPGDVEEEPDNGDSEQQDTAAENTSATSADDTSETPQLNPEDDEPVAEKQSPDTPESATEDNPPAATDASEPGPGVEQTPAPAIEKEPAPEVEEKRALEVEQAPEVETGQAPESEQKQAPEIDEKRKPEIAEPSSEATGQ